MIPELDRYVILLVGTSIGFNIDALALRELKDLVAEHPSVMKELAPHLRDAGYIVVTDEPTSTVLMEHRVFIDLHVYRPGEPTQSFNTFRNLVHEYGTMEELFTEVGKRATRMGKGIMMIGGVNFTKGLMPIATDFVQLRYDEPENPKTKPVTLLKTYVDGIHGLSVEAHMADNAGVRIHARGFYRYETRYDYTTMGIPQAYFGAK